MPELLTIASCRKDWKRISAESSLMSHRRPNRLRDWTHPIMIGRRRRSRNPLVITINGDCFKKKKIMYYMYRRKFKPEATIESLSSIFFSSCLILFLQNENRFFSVKTNRCRHSIPPPPVPSMGTLQWRVQRSPSLLWPPCGTVLTGGTHDDFSQRFH